MAFPAGEVNIEWEWVYRRRGIGGRVNIDGSWKNFKSYPTRIVPLVFRRFSAGSCFLKYSTNIDVSIDFRFWAFDSYFFHLSLFLLFSFILLYWNFNWTHANVIFIFLFHLEKRSKKIETIIYYFFFHFFYFLFVFLFLFYAIQVLTYSNRFIT